MRDDLKDYFTFEAELTQSELDAFESSGSTEDRVAVHARRLEAKTLWEAQGRDIPKGVVFNYGN